MSRRAARPTRPKDVARKPWTETGWMDSLDRRAALGFPAPVERSPLDVLHAVLVAGIGHGVESLGRRGDSWFLTLADGRQLVVIARALEPEDDGRDGSAA